jgi:hypothetical protein
MIGWLFFDIVMSLLYVLGSISLWMDGYEGFSLALALLLLARTSLLVKYRKARYGR